MALRKCERRLQLRTAPVRIGTELGGRQVGERVDLRLGVPERARQLERAITGCHRFRGVIDDHPALREVGVGHREFVPGRHLFEQGDCLEYQRLRLGSLSCEEQQAREDPQRISFAEPILQSAAAVQRLPLSPDPVTGAGRAADGGPRPRRAGPWAATRSQAFPAPAAGGSQGAGGLTLT